MVIDVFPDTGHFVYNVSNKVYFQIWTNSDRVEVQDV